MAEKTVTGGRAGRVWRWQGPWLRACVPLLWAVSCGRSPQRRLARFDLQPSPAPARHRPPAPASDTPPACWAWHAPAPPFVPCPPCSKGGPGVCCAGERLFTQQGPDCTDPLPCLPKAQDFSGLFQFLQVLSPCWAMIYLWGWRELKGLVYSGYSSQPTFLVLTCLYPLTFGPAVFTLVLSISRHRRSMFSRSGWL